MSTVGSPGELPSTVPFGASHGKKPKPRSSQLAQDMELAPGLRTRSRKSHLLPQILPPKHRRSQQRQISFLSPALSYIFQAGSQCDIVSVLILGWWHAEGTRFSQTGSFSALQPQVRSRLPPLTTVQCPGQGLLKRLSHRHGLGLSASSQAGSAP